MCEQNNECDYDGDMVLAVGPKDVYLHSFELDEEYRVPTRLTVGVCPKCKIEDWRTLGLK